MLNQIMRYEPVVALCAAANGTRLLEVGSGARGVSQYLGERWSLTACDLAFDDYGAEGDDILDTRVERVVASVTDLPFADGAFEVVVGLDLLEHLDEAHRRRALHELRRVTSERLVVGCPTGQAALATDQRLARFYDRRICRPRPQWLEEHLTNGFPEPDDLRLAARPTDQLTTMGNVAIGRHGVVARWEAIPGVARAAGILFRLLLPRVREGSRKRWAIEVTRLLRGRDQSPTYRTLVVVDVPA